MPEIFATLAYILIPIALILFMSFKILREYERAVVFTLGRFTGVKGPGLVIIIPFIQQVVKMELRTVVFDIPPQDVISRDNVSVRVSAVVYFRVINPEKAVIQVEITWKPLVNLLKPHCVRYWGSMNSMKC